MSAFIVPEFWGQMLNANLVMLVQDVGGKLTPTVQHSTATGSKQAVVVHHIAPHEARRVVDRFVPIQFTDSTMERRWAFPVDYDDAQRVDRLDLQKVTTDPTSAEVKAMGYAFARAKDNEISGRFFADILTGEQPTTTVTFPSAQTVGVDIGGVGSGMNVEKLLAAREILLANEVDFDNERNYMPITAKQEHNLMAELEITSRDFSSDGGNALKQGKHLTSFLGFTFVHYQRLPVDPADATLRWIPAYSEYAMHLKTWGEVESKISQREDLVAQPWQIYGMMSVGAARMEEKRLVKIVCKES